MTTYNDSSAGEMQSKLLAMGEAARNASRKIANAPAELKNSWLSAMADALESNAPLLKIALGLLGVETFAGAEDLDVQRPRSFLPSSAGSSIPHPERKHKRI